MTNDSQTVDVISLPNSYFNIEFLGLIFKVFLKHLNVIME